MDLQFARDLVVMFMRRDNASPEEAARTASEGLRRPYSEFAESIKVLRSEGQRNALLDSPPGVRDTSLEDEARIAGWYTGVEEADQFWPTLRAKLEASDMRDAVESIDLASTKVVANLADPTLPNLSKRGLVLGYVQSGKTANFTAVLAWRFHAGGWTVAG